MWSNNLDLEEVLEFVKKKQSNGEESARSLLIMDDCAGLSEMNTGRLGSLPALANKSRWMNLSIIIVTQNMTSITPAFRENAEAYILFQTMNRNERKQFLQERNPYVGDQMEAMLEVAHAEPHGFLFQVISDGKGVLNYNGFDFLMQPSPPGDLPWQSYDHQSFHPAPRAHGGHRKSPAQ